MSAAAKKPRSSPSPAGASLSDFTTQRLNANKHTQRGLGMLTNSIGKDGWIGALTVAADNETFDGSARLEVLADAMPSAEPIVIDSDGTRPIVVRRTDIPNAADPRAKRLGIAANRIQQVDYEPDADVLAALAGEIDLSAFWNKDELADIMKGLGGNDAEDPGAQVDRAAELQQKWGTALGQLWQIGQHRLLCGDCTVAENVARLMGGEKAQCIFTDPPYGVDYDGGMKKREKLSGDHVGTDIYGKALPLLAGAADDQAALYLWYADGHAAAAAAAAAGYQIVAQIIWAKNHAQFVTSAHYKGKHEPCFYAHKKGKSARWYGENNEVTLWECNRSPSNDFHPTQKPVELAVRALRNSTIGDDIVLDGFTGGGTTLVACEQLGRRGFGIELDAGYAAVTMERLSGLGLTPELVS